VSRPDWMRKPGESDASFRGRQDAAYARWQEEQDAERERLRALGGSANPDSISLAVGVGTFDSAGNPKGSGWW
jgi:hypothetical protein